MKRMGTLFFTKLLISVILVLIVLIVSKSNSKFKTIFYKEVYENNFSFSKAKQVFNKYIGDIDILDKVIKDEAVFNEALTYSNIEKYKDGAKLDVGNNYLVPASESGIVVFIGNKDNYNNTVIIQRIDGIDEWYGNIDNVNVKLYDYVKKGTLIGEANKRLYLVYKKNGESLNYEEYIK